MSPNIFILTRIGDFEVLQKFPDADIEEILDIFEVRTLINFNYEDRAKRILDYLYSYHDIFIDLDDKKASVVRLESSKDQIESHLRDEIYSLKYLQEGDVRLDPSIGGYVVTKVIEGDRN